MVNCNLDVRKSSPSFDVFTAWCQKRACSRALLISPLSRQTVVLRTFTHIYETLASQPRWLRRRLLRETRLTVADVAFTLTMGAALPAQAAEIFVNTNIPAVAADGKCSLVEAIDNANADARVHQDCTAGAAADVIRLQNASVHTITAGISGKPSQGLPSITSRVTVQGNGATLHVSAVPVDRVFDVASTGNLTLMEATISGDIGSGTATNEPRIHNAGVVQLSNVRVALSPQWVAGIVNTGTLTGDQVLIEPGEPVRDVSHGSGILNVGSMSLTDSAIRNLHVVEGSPDPNTFPWSALNNRGTLRVERVTVTGLRVLFDDGDVSPVLENRGTLHGTRLRIVDNYCSYSNSVINRVGASLRLSESEIADNDGMLRYGSAGVTNDGNAELEHSKISGNTGTVINSGYLKITNGAVASNGTYFRGGIDSQGTLILQNVTVTHNGGLHSGGLASSGTATIANSTFFGNGGSYEDGEIRNYGTMTITGSTVVRDHWWARIAPALLNTGSLSIAQSVVVGTPVRPTDIPRDIKPLIDNSGGTVRSERNLIGEDSVSSAEAFRGFLPGPSDVMATSDGTRPTAFRDIVDVMQDRYGLEIAGLIDHGGPSPTIALAPRSPAIDAGGNTCNATDQRGIKRPQGAACDIGAFEVRPGLDLSGPFVRCPGDINGDRSADVALITGDGKIRVKGLNGTVASEFAVNDLQRVMDVELMSSYDGSSAPKLVVLGTGSPAGPEWQTVVGTLKAEVWEHATGALLSTVNFDQKTVPVDLEILADHNGSGVPELASLGEAPITVAVNDAVSGHPVNTLLYENFFNAMDLTVYPDISGDGVPELAVLGDNKDATKADKLEFRDLVTGRIVKNISLGSSGIVRQQASIRDVNGNGAREAAILQVGHNGAVSVLLRDSKSAGNLGAIGFDQNFPPKQLLTLSDINGNRGDEIVVFGVRKDLSSQKAQIKDSKSKALIRSIGYDKNFVAQDVATCPDLNNNGATEIVMLGQRQSDGKLRAIVKDSKSGTTLGAVDF